MAFSAPCDWYSAAELAALSLPGMPTNKRKINELAQVARWTTRQGEDGQPLARKRSARGGGWEYHVSLLPEAARRKLAIQARTTQLPAAANDMPDQDSGQQWYDQQPVSVKDKAERRLAIVREIEAMTFAHVPKSKAVAEVSRKWGERPSTIWNYLKLISNALPQDYLYRLAPRYSGGGAQIDVDPDIWQILMSDFLRLSRPSWATCYRRAGTIAKAQGIALPSARTLWRKLEREVPREVVTLRRDGVDALRQMIPPQKRSVADLHALELVNIDGHKCDVRVRWPDGRIGRPVMVAIQDVYSRKFLAWRIAESEDTITARLCFADLFARYGIPKGLLADNGRAFASKWLTGGAPNRFRFKVRDEDPVGVLVNLGIAIHWALPYRGSSKPIERGFRDFCDAIAKHPAFEGAYTGNNTLNKPENYGEKAVDLETFQRVWNAGVAEHNARPNRRTEMGAGQFCFDEIFARSYETVPIRKATEDQLRMALYAADQVRADRKTGAIRLLDNSYWSPELTAVAGKRVTARFDPDDATRPVHVYDERGLFVCTAVLWERTGFLDAEAAKRRAKLEAEHRKATKAAERSLDLLTADQLAAMMPDYEDESERPEPRIIRPVRQRGAVAAALKPQLSEAEKPAQPDFIDGFTAAVERRLRVVE